MGILFTIIFVVLGLISTWMTATGIFLLMSKHEEEEEMTNLYEQVYGSVKSGDMPRAILLLEGEPGPMARLLSSILTEATKFTPKLRVAYKVTLESMKRRNQINSNPLRIIKVVAPVLGVLGFLNPVVTGLTSEPSAWLLSLWLFVLSVVIGGISVLILNLAERRRNNVMVLVGDQGRKLLVYLLGSDSPLASMRGDVFPEVQ